MSLNKLIFRPDQTGYGYTAPTGLLVAQLDGGAPRVRADLTGAFIPMNVQWTTDANGYNYLTQTHRYYEASGGEHFLIDLILSHGIISECEAAYVPGTFKLVSTTGTQYVVSAQLWVVQPVGDDASWPDPDDYQDLLTTEDGTLLST